jgi:hypothetical protein
MLPIIFAGHVALILVFSVVGLAVSGFLGARLGFLPLMRIACFALGTSVILETCVQFFGVDIPFWRFFRVLVTGIYVAIGVGANLSPASAGSSPELSYKDIRRRGTQSAPSAESEPQDSDSANANPDN